MPAIFCWLVLGTILAVGLALRFWHIRDCGLSMWDEYSYVRSARWISTFGREGHPHAPDVAPPLYPMLMALCFLLAGFRDWVAVSSSAITSFLTLPALYVLGGRLYGRSSALVATAFLAANPYNVIYARQALTDATFQFFFMLAVLGLFVLVGTGGRTWLWFGGLALGLCECTKYHGFFAWCSVAPGALRSLWKREIRAPALVARVVLPAAMAFAVFLPWLVLVEHEWGIGKLVQHYIGYSALRAESLGSPRELWTYLKLWCGPWLLLPAGVGLCVAARQLRDGDVLLFAWLLLFLVGSSLYFAYPRLLLPVTGCLALAAGRSVLLLPPGRPRMWSAIGLSAVALVSGWTASNRHLVPLGEGYRAAGDYLATRMTRGEKVATLTQPVLWHYVGVPLKDLSEAEIAQSLRAGEPLIVAVDIVAFWPANRRLLDQNRDAMELLQTFENRLSEPDVLSSLGLVDFRAYKRNPDEARWRLVNTIQVFRVTRPWVIPAPGGSGST
jgi:4-amino-4-deoxy-L-arabinose transferase-like glycosyltransferase